jgi:hypothetical protein
MIISFFFVRRRITANCQSADEQMIRNNTRASNPISQSVSQTIRAADSRQQASRQWSRSAYIGLLVVKRVPGDGSGIAAPQELPRRFDQLRDQSADLNRTRLRHIHRKLYRNACRPQRSASNRGWSRACRGEEWSATTLRSSEGKEREGEGRGEVRGRTDAIENDIVLHAVQLLQLLQHHIGISSLVLGQCRQRRHSARSQTANGKREEERERVSTATESAERPPPTTTTPTAPPAVTVTLTPVCRTGRV